MTMNPLIKTKKMKLFEGMWACVCIHVHVCMCVVMWMCDFSEAPLHVIHAVLRCQVHLGVFISNKTGKLNLFFLSAQKHSTLHWALGDPHPCYFKSFCPVYFVVEEALMDRIHILDLDFLFLKKSRWRWEVGWEDGSVCGGALAHKCESLSLEP